MSTVLGRLAGMARDVEGAALGAAVLMEGIVRNSYPLKGSKDIQPLQWSILRYLKDSPQDRSSLTLISEFVGLTSAPVGRAANTLVHRGLAAFRPDPKDKRTKLFSLTEAGKRAMDEDPILVLAEQIGNLGDEQRAAFVKALRELAFEMLEQTRSNDSNGTDRGERSGHAAIDRPDVASGGL